MKTILRAASVLLILGSLSGCYAVAPPPPAPAAYYPPPAPAYYPPPAPAYYPYYTPAPAYYPPVSLGIGVGFGGGYWRHR